MKKDYAYQIDTLRMLAIFSVFCTHSTLLQETTSPLGPQIYDSICSVGGYAVEFFIILSGMLCSYLYNDQLSTRQYIAKKALRMYPMQWVCILIYLPVSLYLGVLGTLRALLPSVLLLQSCFPSTFFSINGPAWTISALMIFFLLVPYLMPLMRHLKRKWVVIAAIVLTLTAWHYQFLYLYSLAPKDVWVFHASPHARFLNFLAGVLLGYLMREFPVSEWMKKQATLCEVSACALLYYLYSRHGSWFGAVDMALCLMIYVFFIGRGWISRFLSLKYWRGISKLTFGFYMIHYLFIQLASILTHDVLYPNGNIPLSSVVILLLSGFVLSLLAAKLLNVYVEGRLTRYIKEKYEERLRISD